MKAAVAAALVVLAPTAVAALEIGPILGRMESAYADIQSYTARFVREERVGETVKPREEVFLKFQRPARIYLRWITGPARNREILFVEGRDAGNVLVHEPAGIARLFTLVIAPDSPRLLKEGRHPVTDVGLGRLVELIVGNARRARARGDLVVHGLADGQTGRGVRRLDLVFPRDPGKGYYCHRAVVAVDPVTGLPVQATIIDWDDRQVASYEYRDLKLNVDLTALDFDAGNPAYGFPRWRVRW